MTNPSNLRHRRPGGGTPGSTDWGVNSEYGVLRDVLLGPPQHFKWLPTSSISKATLRRGHKFDLEATLRQHREMTQAYEDAGVRVHVLEADENFPYQVFARDSSAMTSYGAIITQMAQWWRRGEYAPVLRFYTGMGIPIYEMISAGSFEGGDFDGPERGPQCQASSPRFRGLRSGYVDVYDGWRRRSLHGDAAAPRSGLNPDAKRSIDGNG